MKVFYVSKELVRRGASVSWLQFGSEDRRKRVEGIEFVSLRIQVLFGPIRHLSMIFAILLFCLSSGVNVVYIDEWLMFRSEVFWQLVLRIFLRIAGLRTVFDLRDPYVDYQIAYGKLRYGSFKHALLRIQYALIYRLTDLIVLPSEIYAESYVHEEGIPPAKVIGIPRGIDSDLFNPKVDSQIIKKRLDLYGKFVIGWFGMMHKYRMVDEVIIPVIRNVRSFIPNAYVLIGGKGELLRSFEDLKAQEPDFPFTILGLIPYSDLPSYIAACDVLLCPVNPSFRFTRNSVWLKILESLAVGRPIVATKTGLATGDFKDLKAIIWTAPNLQSFLEALKEVHENYSHYIALASAQALEFQNYATKLTISRLVDRIEQVARR